MSLYLVRHVLRRATRSLWENLYLHSVAIGVIEHLVVGADEPVGSLFDLGRGGRVGDLFDTDNDLQCDSLFDIWRAMVTRCELCEPVLKQSRFRFVL